MVLYSISLLILAALLGFTIIYIGIRHHCSSSKLALGHALLGISGLIFLGIHIAGSSIDKYNNVAALLLVLALIGGGLLFALRDNDSAPPMPAVTIHAIIAVAGLSVLLLGYF